MPKQIAAAATSAVHCNDRSPAATGIRSSLDNQRLSELITVRCTQSASSIHHCRDYLAAQKAVNTCGQLLHLAAHSWSSNQKISVATIPTDYKQCVSRWKAFGDRAMMSLLGSAAFHAGARKCRAQRALFLIRISSYYKFTAVTSYSVSLLSAVA